ncbi:hypothetical protein [Streptomyces parvulus]|uniref:hypothetical protein n=1 Tax=Streptomyces parvulus TaxID=146923 RepID=UPI0037F22F4A
MACGCQKKKAEQFQVVTQAGKGRAVFSTPTKATAVAVSQKYPGSVVKDGTGGVVHTNDPKPPVTGGTASARPSEELK